MKKLAMLLCCAAMLTTLAGCKDAVANISNSSEVLVQVGSTKITKGDILWIGSINFFVADTASYLA